MSERIIHYDFIKYVDNHIAEQLRFLFTEHWEKEWFYDAWNGYRKYILNAVKNKETRVKYPGFIFNKYLKEEADMRHKIKKALTRDKHGNLICPNCETHFEYILGENSCPNCGYVFIEE